MLLNFNKKFNDLSVTATLGSSLLDSKYIQTGYDNGYLLNFANFFSATNLNLTKVNLKDVNDRTQLQAVFFSGQLGYKDMLFLEATARNDWASQLANTPNESFFYPSVGLNAIVSKMVSLPEAISFAKMRASYSEVGNPVPNYKTITTYNVFNGQASVSKNEPFTDLKPELTKSFEIGTDLRFMKDKLSFSVTYYHTNTYNQFFTVNADKGSLYDTRFINAGNIRNQGIESRLAYQADFGALKWNPSINFSFNRNKVLEMLNVTDPNTGITTVQDKFDLGYTQVRLGGSYGDIYGSDFQKDANGNVIVDADGLPMATQEPVKLGNFNPDYLLGFSNSFNYKNFSLNFLVDFRIGGQVSSGTESTMDIYGVTQRTADARDNGGVQIYDKLIPAQTYFNRAATIGSQYIYSATNIRLRETSIGYTFPAKVFNNRIQGIQISLIGRNLWMIYKKAPFDPEVTASTGNGYQAFDYFNQPSLRSFGLSLKVNF
ncbi:SusC/RagA family TonB-linked outer membrane protein [Pedobacter paludis]|uniref:Uncharacterized protein n=1 Tax=Pedobacter paludis TaxID=2203212 RepID=A0A317F4A1_9SPHI|nr:hypothetical protein DF947_07295 [Pedobacter paludis]